SCRLVLLRGSAASALLHSFPTRRSSDLDSPSRNIARAMAALAERYLTNLRVEMVYRTDRYGRGGDQVALLEAGFPAVRVTEAHRSEEHTSELQSLRHLVCRLLLEKKKKK